MIVTIDGPAGAGKSTVAMMLAERLGFAFLDTGAMYRCVVLGALDRGVNLEDPAAVAQFAREMQVEFSDGRILLFGDDVSTKIRTSQITSQIHYAANNPQVRERLVELQRQIAEKGNYVTEGRDQGTVAFPQAPVKFFLTATPQARAERRWKELVKKGETITLEEVLAQQQVRDERDERREYGPLKPAEDAIHILSDDLTIEQVVDLMEARVKDAWGTSE